jgi:hypothetical protein
MGADHAVDLGRCCNGHRDEFIALVAQAARRLSGRGSNTARQAAAWIVLDGEPIIWRGQDSVDTGPIVVFADAMTDILLDDYLQPPEGRRWYFDHPGEVQAI